MNIENCTGVGWGIQIILCVAMNARTEKINLTGYHAASKIVGWMQLVKIWEVAKMKKTVIPRKFNGIICKMLVSTSESKIGDIFHIYKNDFGYLAFNTNTGKYFYCFPSMLRDVNICKFLEVT